MRTELRLVVIIVISAILGFQCTCGPSHDRKPSPSLRDTYEIPSNEQIETLECKLMHSPQELGDIPAFTVPRESYDLILDHFRPNDPVERIYYLPNDVLGELKIKKREGQQLRITWYFTGKESIVFSPDGDNFWQGRKDPKKAGAFVLEYAIREMWRKVR